MEEKARGDMVLLYRPGEEASVKEFDLRLAGERLVYMDAFDIKASVKVWHPRAMVMFSMFQIGSDPSEWIFKCEHCGALWRCLKNGKPNVLRDKSSGVESYLCPYCERCVWRVPI